MFTGKQKIRKVEFLGKMEKMGKFGKGCREKRLLDPRSWGKSLGQTNENKKHQRGMTQERNMKDQKRSKSQTHGKRVHKSSEFKRRGLKDDEKECSTCFLNQRGTKGKNTGKGEVGRGEGGWMQGEKLQKISFFRCHAAAQFHKKSSVSDLEKSKRQIKSIFKSIRSKKAGRKRMQGNIFRKWRVCEATPPTNSLNNPRSSISKKVKGKQKAFSKE